MNKKDKMIVHVDLTRAEYLSEEQQKELGAKEGLVIIERSLSIKAMRKEFDEIIKELQESREKAFSKYMFFMYDTMSRTLKKYKPEVRK